jgi:predicted cupin superfamily sugar epimerase
MTTAADWITRLGLEPHPEGGYFRRIYTDSRMLATPAGDRAAASSIHYLLTRESPVGRFHRNRSRILHYLQQGGPVDYWLLSPDGAVSQQTLGFGPGQALFLDVPGGLWKASALVGEADLALISEVVLPGFDYADHEFMSAARLQREYPQYQDLLLPLVHRTSGD